MVSLGRGDDWKGFIDGITEDEYQNLQATVNRQVHYNGWFTKKNVQQSLLALGEQLTKENLVDWTKNYQFATQPKKVALIMAGNIPLVGFHDFICVLLSGNTAICKLSSDDKTMLPALAIHLIQYVPELKERIEFTTGRIPAMNAVIATGSDNTLNYFEQYFGKYPHIFRKNRTSVAIITGNETKEDFNALGNDIFNYFGLGCRNVSHILFPKDFDLNRFFNGIIGHSSVIDHNKYGNNYDYNKAIYLMNQQQLLDNNFMLLRESTELFSPLSMVHYQYYTSINDVKSYIEKNKEKVQVIVGENYTPFGQAQCPLLTDYADGIDTMVFLEELIEDK